ncbi:hypothetical protein [Longimicrobium sp.]|jgi:hypothetical protein|uniref:hypothetical protein n=1 Tax=Longimicrobium sp. TaxID=2029185 RepID=UPI002EDB4330
MRIITTCFSAALLLAANAVHAQTRTRTIEYGGGMDLITSAINPIAADSAGVGHRAFGLQISGSIIAYRMLSLSAEGGIVGMSDEAAFTQETNQGEKTSGVAGGIGTLSAGVRTPPLSMGGAKPVVLTAGVNAGHSFLHVTRTITNCADCHGEDVSLRAGSFWEPVVTLGLGSGAGAVSARYRTYLGGSDFDDALMVGVSVVPSRRKPAASPPSAESPPAR